MSTYLLISYLSTYLLISYLITYLLITYLSTYLSIYLLIIYLSTYLLITYLSSIIVVLSICMRLTKPRYELAPPPHLRPHTTRPTLVTRSVQPYSSSTNESLLFLTASNGRFSDPELVLKFGGAESLCGYLPWQCRLTTIVLVDPPLTPLC